MRRLIFLAVVCGCLPSTLASRPLPGSAVLLIPAPSSLSFETGSLQIGETKIVKKGEEIASFSISQPHLIKLQNDVNLNVNDYQVSILSSEDLFPFIRSGGPIKERIYCSNIHEKIAKSSPPFVGHASVGPKVCLIDEDDDGTFDHAFFDAIFPSGDVPKFARKPSRINPISYTKASFRKGVEGKYEIMFRGFPVQNDKFTLGMRREGENSSTNFGSLLINSGHGYYKYYSPYFFVKYRKNDYTYVKVCGLFITIMNVDRKKGVVEVSITRGNDGMIFWLDSYHDFAPEYRDFIDSESYISA